MINWQKIVFLELQKTLGRTMKICVWNYNICWITDITAGAMDWKCAGLPWSMHLQEPIGRKSGSEFILKIEIPFVWPGSWDSNAE